MISVFPLAKGAVSAGSHVPVHGSAAGPPRPVEPAGTQPVRPGHHGRSMGEDSDSAQHTATAQYHSSAQLSSADRQRKKERLQLYIYWNVKLIRFVINMHKASSLGYNSLHT